MENTKKITRAMQMVAGAKLRRLQEELVNFRPYATSLGEITRRFLENHPDVQHKFLAPLGLPPALDAQEEASQPPAGLLVITSDTGLCGTYNERMLGLTENFIRENPSTLLVTIGKKGNRSLSRKGVARAKEILDWGGRYDPAKADELFVWMKERYGERHVSAWWVVFTQFHSAFAWKPTVAQLLPMERPPAKNIPEKFILEPDQEAFAQALLSRSLSVAFREMLLSAFTSEHSARMMSMRNATENAAEMIDHLTLVRNKVRQAAITKELIEVVSGSEALR